mmetsp:Transcript_29509/g.53764  ORF Transcript_29509/g.53764 Transcript_29509/m.53764 type:complete len:80 (+) Transcript_29509:58-297(+)
MGSTGNFDLKRPISTWPGRFHRQPLGAPEAQVQIAIVLHNAVESGGNQRMLHAYLGHVRPLHEFQALSAHIWDLRAGLH